MIENESLLDMDHVLHDYDVNLQTDGVSVGCRSFSLNKFRNASKIACQNLNIVCCNIHSFNEISHSLLSFIDTCYFQPSFVILTETWF